MEDLRRLIGSNIKKHRSKRGLTQEGLAGLSGLHTTFIAHIESGRKVCSIKSLQKIAAALNTPLHLLLVKEDLTNIPSYDTPTRKLISMVREKSDSEKDLIISIAESVLKSNKRKPSRSHCMVAPAMKMLPSSA